MPQRAPPVSCATARSKRRPGQRARSTDRASTLITIEQLYGLARRETGKTNARRRDWLLRAFIKAASDAKTHDVRAVNLHGPLVPECLVPVAGRQRGQ